MQHMGSLETGMTMTPTEQFAAWLADNMRAAGLDIDKQRGGGRSTLAERVGVAPSTINRWLAGTSMPEPGKFEPIATALGRDVIEMLVEIGVLSANSVTPPPDAVIRSRPMTPTQAADALGIRSPGDRDLLISLINRLNSDAQGPTGKDDRADGGATAAGQ